MHDSQWPKPARHNMAADASEPKDDGKTDKKKDGGGNMLLYVLLGGGLLLCCCCSLGGGGGGAFWYFGGPNPLVANWESRDINGNRDIQLGILTDGKGMYTRAGGPMRNFKWKTLDKKTLELEMSNQADRFWTDETKSKFNYTITGNVLTLTPLTATKKDEVKLSKAN